MACLACRGARGAESAVPPPVPPNSYNGDDARRYLRWWKGTRDLYSEATREIVRLQLCLDATQAALIAAEGETSTARAMLSDVDGRVAGTDLLSEQNLF